MIVEGEGPGVIKCYDDNDMQTEMKLSKALYTPTLAMNLLSVPSLVQKSATVIFDVNDCRAWQLNYCYSNIQGLYYLKQPSEVILLAVKNLQIGCMHKWHRKFEHRDPKAIVQME